MPPVESGAEGGSYPCPCCGFLTLHGPPGGYGVCAVCFWEDDGVQLKYPTYAGGANGLSLIDAQSNYRRLGACDPQSVAHVRPPLPGERREQGWRPIDPEIDNIPAAEDLSLPWPDDRATLYWWRPTFWRR